MKHHDQVIPIRDQKLDPKKIVGRFAETTHVTLVTSTSPAKVSQVVEQNLPYQKLTEKNALKNGWWEDDPVKTTSKYMKRVISLMIFFSRFIYLTTDQSPSRWWFQIFFVFTLIWGRFPILTNIFQMGWNHQLPHTKYKTTPHRRQDEKLWPQYPGAWKGVHRMVSRCSTCYDSLGKKVQQKTAKTKEFSETVGATVDGRIPKQPPGMVKNPINNGIIIILGGAGFQISTVGGYFFAVARWPISGDFYGFLMPRVLSRKSNQRSDSFQDDVAIWWVSWWQVRGKMLTEPFVASF